MHLRGSLGATDFTSVSLTRVGGAAAIALAITWAIAAITTGAAVGFEVGDADGLLDTVADHRVLFVGSNVVAIGAQALVVPFLLGLSQVLDRRRAATLVGIGWWALSAPLFGLSSAFHAVYGHVPAQAIEQDPSARTASLVRDADVLHHLGDFTYFAGVAMVTIALLALVRPMAASPHIGRAAAIVAGGTLVANALQFGWLVDLGALQAFGILGILGQVSLLLHVGVRLLRVRF